MKKTKKEQQEVKFDGNTISVQLGLVGVSMSLKDDELKVETTPDMAIKTIKDCEKYIRTLEYALDFIKQERFVHTCDGLCDETCICDEDEDEDFHVGPCYVG